MSSSGKREERFAESSGVEATCAYGALRKCYHYGMTKSRNRFINTTPPGPRRKVPGGGGRLQDNGEDTKNCAACTAAGAVNLITNTNYWTTSLVATARAQADDHKAMGGESDKQAIAIRTFVGERTRHASIQIGKGGHNEGVDYLNAEAWMKAFPHKTVFAVSVEGRTSEANSAMHAHWLNAMTFNGEVYYIDYQPNREVIPTGVSNACYASNLPIIGIVPQVLGVEVRNVPIPEQLFDVERAKMMVVAFTPIPTKDSFKGFEDLAFEFAATSPEPASGGTEESGSS